MKVLRIKRTPWKQKNKAVGTWNCVCLCWLQSVDPSWFVWSPTSEVLFAERENGSGAFLAEVGLLGVGLERVGCFFTRHVDLGARSPLQCYKPRL